MHVIKYRNQMERKPQRPTGYYWIKTMSGRHEKREIPWRIGYYQQGVWMLTGTSRTFQDGDFAIINERRIKVDLNMAIEYIKQTLNTVK